MAKKTAAEAKEQTLQNRDKLARQWIKDIDDMIDASAKLGAAEITIDIPVNITSDLITEYQARGFTVSTTSPFHIKISWE